MHFRAIHPVEEFLETRVNFRVGGTVVLGTIERIIQQKTFAGKNYSLFWAKLRKIRNRKWHQQSQSSETSEYLMPPLFWKKYNSQ